MRGIKKLLKIPIKLHPFEGRDDMLDNTYGAPILTTCYAESKVQVVTDMTGKEVVSNITIYLDGSEKIDDSDVVTFDGNDYFIKALLAVRELDGDIALWMVYV